MRCHAISNNDGRVGEKLIAVNNSGLKFTAIFLAALGILGGITAEMIKAKPAFSPSESHPVIMVEEEIPPTDRKG